MGRVGKIARLPEAVREELNHRLLAGEPGPKILDWLGGQPAVAAILAEQFQNKAINAENLSAWRLGGFADWEEKRSRTWRTKELASYAVKLAEANGSSIAEGAAALVSGRLLELLEAATETDGKLTVDEIRDVVLSLTGLRGAEIAQQRADIDREKLKQKDAELQLAREKFQRDTAETVLKSARDEAVQQIANAPLDHTAQLNAVGKHLFGDLWK